MNFAERLGAAHQELESKGVWHANYNPPLLRLLRRLGLRLRPPHYERFMVNLLAFGLPTGAIWGVLMWYLGWQDEVSPAFALRQSLLFGIGVGLLMATWLWCQTRRTFMSCPGASRHGRWRSVMRMN